jgi:hypothetical protein
MFRGSIGLLRDMLTPLAYIGRGFREFCGIHFVYFTTDTHPNIKVVSLPKSVFLDAGSLLLFLCTLFLDGSLSRSRPLDSALLTPSRQQLFRPLPLSVNNIRMKWRPTRLDCSLQSLPMIQNGILE